MGEPPTDDTAHEGTPALGKIDRTFFETQIAPKLGAGRDDVLLGPTHGVDFGVLEVGGQAVAIATDPLSILPELGFERTARFALDLILADVAVSGLAPSHLSICFTLPPSMTDDQFGTIWDVIHEECADLGVAITTGHTARYAGCSYSWIGSATVLGVGDHQDLVRPDGARPGDRLLLTTGPAVEAVGLLSTIFGDRVGVSGSTLEAAQRHLDEVYCVRDALTAAATGDGGVRAMHDVTEGGLAGALNEMATGADVRFEIERKAVPLSDAVDAVCTALEIDPWAATSCGSLVIAVSPEAVESVRQALEDRGTTVADIGTVTDRGDGPAVTVDGEPLAHPDSDPSWAAYARLLEGEEST